MRCSGSARPRSSTGGRSSSGSEPSPVAAPGSRLLGANVVRSDEHRTRLFVALALGFLGEEQPEGSAGERFTEWNATPRVSQADLCDHPGGVFGGCGSCRGVEEESRLVQATAPARCPRPGEELGERAREDLLQSGELGGAVEDDRAVAYLTVAREIRADR